MLGWVFGGLIVLSVVCGAITGNLDQVANAILTEGGNAVALVGAIAGGICFWSGIMRIAEKSRLSEILGAAISPLIRLLFRELDPKGEAAGKIAMNMVANFLGLGNAATPLGIAAMQAMEKEQRTAGRASNSMVLLVVLNTASFQLIPTTTAMIRQSMGAVAPFDILPAVWLSSLVSVAIGIICAKTLGSGRSR